MIEKVFDNGDFIAIEAAGKRYFTMRTDKKEMYERNIKRYEEPVFIRMRFDIVR
ncbi:MAG: hypothetical protein N3E50_08430 [Candidatus Goldbacteria bacterium]|nr:hypothetical protein [Candidatus Goldiibacteriota bacterium]